MKNLAQIADELEAEVIERKELLKQLVGNLYPQIVSDEISRLVAARWEVIKK